MNWVIPPDSSPGAGTPETLTHLLGLIEREGLGALYLAHFTQLTQENLGDPNHPFGPLFVEHVRDVYYAFANTGAWKDIGFQVTD